MFPISDPVAVMAALVGVAAFFFWLEKVSGWRVFDYLVPLIWIYAVPVLLRHFGVLPAESAAYDVLGRVGLPFVIVLLLLKVDVGAAVRIMGKGVVVMLLGTAGVVVGAVVGYAAVDQWLAPDAWKGFAALSGSWIGGTGNLAAVAAGVEAPPEQFGLAVVADTAMYLWWLPLLLGAKALAPRFNKWAKVPEERVARMDEAAAAARVEEERPAMRHFLYLALIGLAGAWAAYEIAAYLPVSDVFSTSTWVVLLVTVFGIALSFTGAKRLPASHDVAMAVLYVFVARMGATASLEGLAQAPAFLLGTAIWITIHGLFCLAGAWLLKVDIHSAAIASAANIGGAASAPVVAAHHRESLVPVSILMALIGYALGNPVGLLVVAPLCSWVAGL